MRDLVNALDATQVNVVNEAGMQLGRKSIAWHSTVKHLHSDLSLTPIVLNPFGILPSQFEQLENGGMDVLDEAISLRREHLVLCPAGNRYREASVKALMKLLEKRREVTGGEIKDLEAESAVLQRRHRKAREASGTPAYTSEGYWRRWRLPSNVNAQTWWKSQHQQHQKKTHQEFYSKRPY
jgi:hypothetical protein